MVGIEIVDKAFYTQLNGLIEDHGYIFGPSQLALIMYGPIDKSKIRKTTLAILKERESSIELNYRNNILPKIHQIVTPLTNSKADFPKKKDLESKLMVIPFEVIREEARHFFREYGDFEMDIETKNNFLSNRKMKDNEVVRFGFDFKHGFIFSTRTKQDQSTAKKITDKYTQLSLTDKSKFGDFVLEVCKFPLDYWNEDCQEMMHNEFSEKLNRLMINDYLGLKIVEFNQKRAELNLERLSKEGPNILVKGFKGILRRFDDHREDKINKVPGGIHLTFVDSGHINYPIEIQYLDSESFILDLFGPNCHYLYTLRGKNKNREKH